MVTTARPNREALSKAIDTYRDAMRPFILRCLRRVTGVTVETVIQESLPDKQAENFRSMLSSGNDLESALDINYFPNLISNFRNWRDVFAVEFSGDKTVQSELWMITEARNQVSHPGTQDLEAEYTRTGLYLIADVLGRINPPELRWTVEEIRNQLVASASDTGPHQSENQATMESRPQGGQRQGSQPHF